jgi:ACS family hexuronate transporter-like MFS transporter
MLNYMDRQVLSNLATSIKSSFHLSDRDYGSLELAFSWSFALGGIITGFLADRFRVRLLYPLAVVVWSAAGMLTAAAGSFAGLLACRAVLGLAEAGHWPCGIRTTRRILEARDRPIGNGVLQSGAALGAAITPFVILWLCETSLDWRRPFVVVGVAGLFWAALWLLLYGERMASRASPPGEDFSPGSPAAGAGPEDSFKAVLLDRRLWILAALSGLFNAPWQFLRAWLPSFLGESRHYGFEESLWFTFFYYLAADAGSIACGWFTSALARRGMPVAKARMRVMLFCSLLATLAGVVGWLPRGPLFQALVLVVGFGTLGIFPNYYSFTQEISARHQGKVTGIMGLSCWILVGPLQLLAGAVNDHLGKESGYLLNLAVGGFFPLAGMALLWLFWPRESAGETVASGEAS